MTEFPAQQIPTIAWLVQSGGAWLLVWGLVVAVAGIRSLIRPQSSVLVTLGLLSLLPAIFGTVVVYFVANEYAEMAAASAPPKPSEFAALTARAMSYSFCSLLGTFVGSLMSLAAMARFNSRLKSAATNADGDSVPQ